MCAFVQKFGHNLGFLNYCLYGKHGDAKKAAELYKFANLVFRQYCSNRGTREDRIEQDIWARYLYFRLTRKVENKYRARNRRGQGIIIESLYDKTKQNDIVVF